MKKEAAEKKISPPRPRRNVASVELAPEVLPNNGGTKTGNGALASNNGASETQMLMEGMVAFRNGDFSVRLPSSWTGIYGKIADAFNEVLAMNERRARETTRVSRVVGREGRLKQRMTLSGLVGGWADE